jgi:hypothetical protein
MNVVFDDKATSHIHQKNNCSIEKIYKGMKKVGLSISRLLSFH